MIFKSFRLVMASALMLVAAAPAVALVGTSAFEFQAPGAVRSTRDWSFASNLFVISDVRVVGLGIYSGGQTPVGNKVNLYQCDSNACIGTGQLVATAIINAGATVIGNFAYASIDPILIDARYSYQMVGTMPLGYNYTSDTIGFYSDPRVAYATRGNAFVNNLDAKFSPMISGVVNDGFWGPNLLLENAVPEPQAWAMLIAGFGLTGVVMRSRRSRIAVA
jgi:hypothetical protein